MEQSDFPVYEGVHEAITAEEDWKLAQEKRSKNNYKREKIHDPEHVHILSGILKCPCCGKGMYGNIAKAGRKDNKTRYYYYCKNTVNATGHKCTFRRNIEQSQIDDMLATLITAMTKEGKFKDAIQDKIGATVDTTDLEKQLSVLNASLHQAETIKTRLEQQMDNLDVTDTHYDKKISDLQSRLDAQYDRIDEVEETRAELTKATYDEIKKYVAEHNAGMKVSNLYISQVKRKCGIEVGKNLRVATRRMDCLQGNSTTAATDLELVPSPNLPKNEDSRQPQCPEDKESAIVEALKHFKMNS